MGRNRKAIVGDVNEYKATIEYLEKGYMVFKNVSASGSIDLVIIHPDTGDIKLIDVKTKSYRKTGRIGTQINRHRSKEQIRLGVQFKFMERE